MTDVSVVIPSIPSSGDGETRYRASCRRGKVRKIEIACDYSSRQATGVMPLSSHVGLWGRSSRWAGLTDLRSLERPR